MKRRTLKLDEILRSKFGLLKPIMEVERYRLPCGQKKRRFLCLCECGVQKNINLDSLIRGLTKSCGHLWKNSILSSITKHGHCGMRIYNIYRGMKSRCLTKSCKAFKWYGGRGIKICKRWIKFDNFLFDMQFAYLKHIKEHGEKNTTLDRRDNNGDYSPINCKWSTRKEQSINRRPYDEWKH